MYQPYGNTPLHAAVVRAISLSKTFVGANEKNTSFLIIVVTDGEENSSNERYLRCHGGFQRVIEKALVTERYTFAFSVPELYNKQALVRQHVPMNCIQVWEQTEAGVREMTYSTEVGTQSYFNARSVGQTKVDSFYVDANHLKKADVKANLTDISGTVKVWTVDSAAPGGTEWAVKPFIESHGRAFVTGCAFVELTKAEKLLPQHELAVRERGRTEVYAGKEARELLGLPADKTVKIVPGNFGKWEVFKQSTSINRVVPRGARVIYNGNVSGTVKPTWDPVAAEAAAVERQRHILSNVLAIPEDRVWAAIRTGNHRQAEIIEALGPHFFNDGSGRSPRRVFEAHIRTLKDQGRVTYSAQDGWVTKKQGS